MRSMGAENNGRKQAPEIGAKNNKLNTENKMKTKVQKKQRCGYVIVHDKNDLLEDLGYASRKQASINHKNVTK